MEKVLIVDDTPSNLTLLGSTLEHLYDVRVAIGGREALELIEKDRPDIILLDIMMPEMDGYELITRIKADSDMAEIPVIFLTALTENEDERRGLELGAVDFIRKPILPDLVAARVGVHLNLIRQKRILSSQAEELKRKNSELEMALKEVKTLRGILPMCSFCKKIRNDKEEWILLESYIDQNSDANISHGLCPECVKIHYPEF
ncbi:MAG: response regulator [Desulfamplus sp.]|nr:response regulator [Desulfamplus sp.]